MFLSPLRHYYIEITGGDKAEIYECFDQTALCLLLKLTGLNSTLISHFS
jgi:hypothetical protein